METRIRGRQNHHHNNKKLEVEEGEPRPVKQLYSWYTEGNQPTVTCQKAPDRLLQEDKTDRILSVFRCINRSSDSATQSMVGPLLLPMNSSRNVFLLYLVKVSICSRLENFLKSWLSQVL